MCLLIPVAQPTVRTRCLLDLGLLPFLAGSVGPCNDPLHVRTFYKHCTCFADTCCPTHSPHAAYLGPWTPPPPCRLIRTPRQPPSMYVHFMDVVRSLLIPVVHPTVCARCLQDLGHIPLLAGLFGSCDDPSPCTYVLQVVCAPC
jgi:hypothetical protein